MKRVNSFPFVMFNMFRRRGLSTKVTKVVSYVSGKTGVVRIYCTPLHKYAQHLMFCIRRCSVSVGLRGSAAKNSFSPRSAASRPAIASAATAAVQTILNLSHKAREVSEAAELQSGEARVGSQWSVVGRLFPFLLRFSALVGRPSSIFYG